MTGRTRTHHRWLPGTLAGVLGFTILATTPRADAPVGYYNSVDATSAATLRRTLHDVIDDHTRVPYTANARDVWDVLKLADQDPADPSRILDVYKNASYPKAEGGNANYNREHTWPKSYGFKKDGAGNYPFTDGHHHFLSDSRYNESSPFLVETLHGP